MSVIRRDKHRQMTRAEILRIAARQIAASQDITLRAIAREMHMTSPGLYRYYPNAAAVSRALADAEAERVLPVLAAGGWPACTLWAEERPGWFALLAKPVHADLMARLHAAAAGDGGRVEVAS